jgi:hypothetical protein
MLVVSLHSSSGVSDPRRPRLATTVALLPVELSAVVRDSISLGMTEPDPARSTTRLLLLDRPEPPERETMATKRMVRLAKGSAPIEPSGPSLRSVYAQRSALLQPPRGPRRSRETLRVEEIKAVAATGGESASKPPR